MNRRLKRLRLSVSTSEYQLIFAPGYLIQNGPSVTGGCAVAITASRSADKYGGDPKQPLICFSLVPTAIASL